MIFRTEEAKKNLARSWQRLDRPFFAAGACHVLAAAFLKTYPKAGFHAFLILPETNLRGSHVAVTNGLVVFDYHGYVRHDAYLAHYFSKIRRFYPGWQGKILRLEESPTAKSFCQKYQHRLPDQYWKDPQPRAVSYLNRFPPPHLLETDPRQAQDDRWMGY